MCSADDFVGTCFRLADEGAQFVPETYARTFEGDGPDVIHLLNRLNLAGFTICETDTVAEHPARCCRATMSELCEGIEPIPLSE